MRLLVLGSSSSVGTGLPDRSLAWPWIVERELPALIGEPIELVHQIVFPVGPKALPIAFAAIDSADPDVVVHSFGFFPAIITTVSERVMRRYGKRAHGLYRRVIERYEGGTGRTDGKPARANRWGRRIARAVIGADPIASVDEVMGNLTGIQHRLAQREGLVVVSMCEPNLSTNLRRDHPKASRVFETCRVQMEAVARSHHFAIADCASGYDRHPFRDSLFLSDGLHKNVEGQRIQADAVIATLMATGTFPGAAVREQRDRVATA